jgi:hypothetical protein
LFGRHGNCFEFHRPAPRFPGARLGPAHAHTRQVCVGPLLLSLEKPSCFWKGLSIPKAFRDSIHHQFRAGVYAATTKKKDIVWFALNEDRPLFAFGGIWTVFNGDRGTKSKPIAGPHLVYGFLTTVPNAVVAPIHPKAIPRDPDDRRGA